MGLKESNGFVSLSIILELFSVWLERRKVQFSYAVFIYTMHSIVNSDSRFLQFPRHVGILIPPENCEDKEEPYYYLGNSMNSCAFNPHECTSILFSGLVKLLVPSTSIIVGVEESPKEHDNEGLLDWCSPWC